ncbi:MAG: S-layer protein domain-containing protein, partial [Euryarchaeota archaeon]|nr:S-layer protein domain-containing protein [Euryarchaeota archaeon]
EATWDHMNFEGFYYNIDDDLGTETLVVEVCNGNTIPEDGLLYTTTAEPVEFDFSDWGSFNVVGFMAESYFAGYEKGVADKDITNENINLLSKDMLSKVLVDVEDDRMISTGASLPLCEDYELKVIQLDVDGGQAQLELMKDGKSVDTEIVSSPDTYVYEKDLGKLDDVPIVVVYIGNVFAGTESDLVTIEGAFQISDDPITIDNGDEYGEMEITSASGDKIEMRNRENDIDLDEGEKTLIMGNVGFMTSDDGGERYCLFVRRTIGAIAALKIELPESLIVDEEIVITVTADGDPVEGVQVQFAGENLDLTDSDGKVTVTSEEAGTFTIVASKENYDSASVEMRILTESEAEEDPLEIEMPDTAEPGEDVVIKVMHEGDAIENASITWDGDDIGDTDETGSLTYTTEDEGTYTVTTSKEGYLDDSEEIEVAYPSAEFELADFTFPENVSVNKEFTVYVDVTNTGDDSGTYLAELKVNDTVVDSQNVTLDAGDTENIEFTTKIAEAGTTTIEIGTESGEITVTKAKSNTTLIAAVLIVLALLGAVGYLLISTAPEGGWTVGRLSDAIKDKFQRGGKEL